MHPDTDHQAVRRVLAKAGITGAAAALSVAAAIPAFAGTHTTTTHGKSSAAHDKAATHDKSAGDNQGDTGSDDTSSPSDDGGSSAGSGSDQGGTDQGGTDQGGTDHGGTNGAGKGANGGGGSGGSGGSGANSDSGHNPPGNNGTVKIHDDANDPSHHNVPHVSCDFYVDFWGFDNGQQMTVSFAGQAPTGKDTPVTFTALSPGGYTDTSTTDAGGGNDFDGELGFTASQDQLSVLGSPQAQQGYHIKMTVDTGAPGGHKYKVFWIQPCQSETGGGGTPGGGGENGGGGTPGGGDTPGGGGTPSSGGTNTPPSTSVLGEKVTKPVTSPQTPSVLGTTANRPTATPTALPFTGAEIAEMSIMGAAALAGGAGLVVAGRRRRRGAAGRA